MYNNALKLFKIFKASQAQTTGDDEIEGKVVAREFDLRRSAGLTREEFNRAAEELKDEGMITIERMYYIAGDFV